MTVRVIRLGDPAAGDPRMGGTVAERVAAVDELTRLAWTLAGRRFPRYRRSEMPVVVTTLAADAELRQRVVIEDFRDLLAAFARTGVRFMVVGAHALAAHGIPRTTGDLDVWVDPTSENAGRVWEALRAFGAPLDALKIEENDFSQPDVIVQLGLPPYRIDVMTGISGLTFAAAWGDRLKGEMLGVPVAFLGRKSFLVNKRASGRPKDLRDLEALE